MPFLPIQLAFFSYSACQPHTPYRKNKICARQEGKKWSGGIEAVTVGTSCPFIVLIRPLEGVGRGFINF